MHEDVEDRVYRIIRTASETISTEDIATRVLRELIDGGVNLEEALAQVLPDYIEALR